MNVLMIKQEPTRAEATSPSVGTTPRLLVGSDYNQDDGSIPQGGRDDLAAAGP